MSRGLLLDTHIALWLESGSPRLLSGTRSLIDKVWRSGETVYLSAVSAWEIAQLSDKARVTLDVEPSEWVRLFLDGPGIVEAPLTASAAALAYDLPDFPNRDPADRMLVATARELGCPFVTYDRPVSEYIHYKGLALGLSLAEAFPV